MDWRQASLNPEGLQRRDRRYPRVTLKSYNESAFKHLFDSGNDQALINATGVDHLEFGRLLQIFEPLFDGHIIDENTGRISEKLQTGDGQGYLSKSKWQTSRRRRFSPFGGDSSPGEIFGAFPNGNSCLEGEKKLEGIMRVLYELVEWIDSLEGKGCDPISEIPISLIRSRIESCCREIPRKVPIQMGLFRVSLFVTLITGCGMLKDGVHLWQLAFPVKKCASFEHLKKPSGGVISEQLGMVLSGDVTNEVPSGTREFNGIEEEDHDRAMMLISNAMGFQQYHRDTIERLLVC
eukprot:scaffold6507_cov90-Cylindrotheca_fusiformis.AAC.4